MTVVLDAELADGDFRSARMLWEMEETREAPPDSVFQSMQPRDASRR